MIEAILSPVHTKDIWIYSLANFHEALAFSFLGLPIPKKMRIFYMKHLFYRKNFKKLIFWSFAGYETLQSYGNIKSDDNIQNKVEIVYPAIRRVSDGQIKFKKNVGTLLFSGDFLRKGGVHVVDSFFHLQSKYPNLKLIICSDENVDFVSGNTKLNKKYIDKIKSNPSIIFGRVSRDRMINEILPNTDIYLIPTYEEAFGFAILEAMAYGIPVVSTNIFAIPEMIKHGESGFCIDVSMFEVEKFCKGYVVNRLPQDFNKYITKSLYSYIVKLIESPELRMKFSVESLKLARSKFSFEVRNRKMESVYEMALSISD